MREAVDIPPGCRDGKYLCRLGIPSEPFGPSTFKGISLVPRPLIFHEITRGQTDLAAAGVSVASWGIKEGENRASRVAVPQCRGNGLGQPAYVSVLAFMGAFISGHRLCLARG